MISGAALNLQRLGKLCADLPSKYWINAAAEKVYVAIKGNKGDQLC